MSEPIPESIPTSADPRSRRPLKKARPSGTNAASNPANRLQSSAVSALFANPEREIHIPTAATPGPKPLSAPPEIVANVQGSSAGAGSGEFHVYKASRRREYERLRAMEEEKVKEEGDREFEVRREEVRRRDEEKREKNRAKRDKRKGKGKEKGTGQASTEGRSDGLEKAGEGRVDLAAQRSVRTGNKDEETNGRGNAIEAAVQEDVGIVIHDDD